VANIESAAGQDDCPRPWQGAGSRI